MCDIIKVLLLVIKSNIVIAAGVSEVIGRPDCHFDFKVKIRFPFSLFGTVDMTERIIMLIIKFKKKKWGVKN